MLFLSVNVIDVGMNGRQMLMSLNVAPGVNPHIGTNPDSAPDARINR